MKSYQKKVSKKKSRFPLALPSPKGNLIPLPENNHYYQFAVYPSGFFSMGVQFSSVQSLSRVWLFATPWIAARQASLFYGWEIDKYTYFKNIAYLNIYRCRWMNKIYKEFF